MLQEVLRQTYETKGIEGVIMHVFKHCHKGMFKSMDNQDLNQFLIKLKDNELEEVSVLFKIVVMLEEEYRKKHPLTAISNGATK